MTISASSAVDRMLRGEDLCTPDFWRSLAPCLHVGELACSEPTTPRQSYTRLSERMRKDGYFGDSDDRLIEAAGAIGEAVKRCVELGLPPVFVWVFDESWDCFRRLAPVFRHFLGEDYRLLPSFWAWHVDPSKSEAGWQPHRDNSKSLGPDGAPLSLTCWIPLTDANPLNSCIYVLPAHLDPCLAQPPSVLQATPNLALARALPAKPGEYLIWNQVVLHWGAMSSEFANGPRMSMALEFQRGDVPPFRAPLLEPQELPPFAVRIRLIAMQILQFTHMYGWSEHIVRLAKYLQTAPLR